MAKHRLHRLGLCLVTLLGVCHPAGPGWADDRHGFYRMLLSEEERALEAIRQLSINGLLAVHHDAMGDRPWSSKPEPICLSAYIRLSVAVLGYASAIDPTRSQPARSSREHANLADKWWAEYLDLKARCAKAIGLVGSKSTDVSPSELLQRVIPGLPKQD